MRLAITALSLAMLTIPSAAKTGILDLGTGTESCAAWLATPYSESAGTSWILGFWTGANWGTQMGGGSGDVGSTTDNLGIIGEVKKRCMNSPSNNIANTAADVFGEFVKARK